MVRRRITPAGVRCSYSFCGPTDTDGEGNDQCFKGQKVAETVGTAVKYSTRSDFKNSKTATTAGTYPTSVRSTRA